ncbi:MAG: FGGY-family carbohydrate kinase [Candidatus Methanomethylicaceae archaeon]
MSKSLVIGIDSSTTACKAIAWDAQGQATAEGRSAYPMLHPRPTWYEQDADQWWIGTCAALKELISKIDISKVEALCLTNQRESFVPVDRQGKPIRNGILWLDERSRAQVEFLGNTFGKEHLHQVTGKPCSMTPSLPKIVWLIQNEPDVVERTYKFLEPHAFHVFRLTGEFRTSLACADPMGLVDMRSHRWAEEIIKELGLRVDQFPDLSPPGEIIGRVSKEAAAVSGLPEGLPVVAGAGDGQCAGLGANTASPGRAYLNLGTAVVGGAFSAEYLANPAFRTLYAPLAGNYYLETVIRGGVFTIGWFVEKFAADLRSQALMVSPEELLEVAAAKVPPGCLGLMLVPYWNNVMNPYWDQYASGIVVGWTGVHGREHFYRAIMEGIAFEQRLAGDGVMAALGRKFDEYVVMGGGSRSKLWNQIIADVTGIPIRRSTSTEATCLGAGILAAAAAGWYPSVASAAQAMTSTAEWFEPNSQMRDFYNQLYEDVYRHLFPTIQSLIDRLTQLTNPQ